MEEMLGAGTERPPLHYETPLETEAEKNACQCGWYGCSGPHGVDESCERPAVGTWTGPDGKKFNLCFGCYEAGDRGRPLPANEWVEYESERPTTTF
jgi:hypothetical protein